MTASTTTKPRQSSSSRKRLFKARLATFVLLALLPSAAIVAQNKPKPKSPSAEAPKIPLPPQQKPDIEAEKALRDKGLSPERFNAETIGLTMHLPLGAKYVADKRDGKLVITVSDDPSTPSWTMQIQPLTSSLQNPSAKAQIDDLLRDLQKSKQEIKVLSNAPGAYGNAFGQLCFLQRVSSDKQEYVTGWLILPNGENSFLVFAMQTLPEHFATLRPLWEASFATIELRNGMEVSSDRRMKLDAGRILLSTFSKQTISNLLDKPQWHRIYRPADSSTGVAETEIGYTRVDILESMRGALNATKPAEDYTPTEQQLGLLVRVTGRVIIDAQRKHFYDTIASYWMTWDQTEESWSVLATNRDGKKETSEAETAVRSLPFNRKDPATGAEFPMPSMIRVLKSVGKTQTVPYDWEVPEGYMSQALGWIVGRLMPHDIDRPREYAYYYYVPNNLSPKIYLRLDTWEPASDRSGKYTLQTRLTSDTPPFTSTYASDGSLIRRVRDDGSVTEPISFDELRRIWVRKGLPVSESGK